MSEAQYTHIDQRVGYLHLNHHPANGYTEAILTELYELYISLERDDIVKTIVIQSDLERFFCAGADIKVYQSNTPDQNQAMVAAARRLTTAIADSPKMVICAIRGHALGGGLEIALACDLRLGAQGDYRLGLPEIQLGLMPGNGGAPRLVDLIGLSRASELLLTGGSIGPQRAYEIGLFHQLFAESDFDTEVKQYAERLAAGPALAMAQTKRFLSSYVGMSTTQGLDLETACVSALYGTPDAEEAFRAFVEKRKPKFR